MSKARVKEIAKSKTVSWKTRNKSGKKYKIAIYIE